jgi:NADPH2:quinone reductase
VKTRAARLVEHGKPLEVLELELPEPADDEVLVELSYAGVNPVDRYNLEGSVAPDGPVPRTLGGEGSGHVAGVPVIVAGEGVGVLRDGVFAEAAVVPRASIVEIPNGVSLRDAAAVGIAGLTALRVVEIAEIGPSDRVLVLGGSGGVGLSAISFAASKGAQVWGQTGTASKAAAITAMGATNAVVADAAGLADAIREFSPTAVLDSLGGNFTTSALGVLAPRGRMVVFGASSGPEASIQLHPFYRRQQKLLTYGGGQASRDERRAALKRVLAAMADGSFRVTIAADVDLDSVNEAFGLLTDRKVIGKVLLKLS